METLLEYYNFTPFFKDRSGFFNQNLICYSLIRDDLFLVFEQIEEGEFKLWFVQFADDEGIGNVNPDAANLLIDNFEIDLKEHRELLQKYLDYN